MALFFGHIGKSGGLEYTHLTPDMVSIHRDSPHGHVLIKLSEVDHVIEIPLVTYQQAMQCLSQNEVRGLRTVIYP